MVFAMMNKHVTTCIIVQNVLKVNATHASLMVRIGTSGLSSSVLPIK
jgi:hypothetical protein